MWGKDDITNNSTCCLPIGVSTVTWLLKGTQAGTIVKEEIKPVVSVADQRWRAIPHFLFV